MSDKEKVCLPGFNDCERPERKKPEVAQSGVCLPGFNDCNRPAVPKQREPIAAAANPGVCLPGFNDCMPGAAEAAEAPAVASGYQKFDKSVLMTDKTVVLLFSAPWCQHCKALTPIVEELVAANADSMTLVKINIDEEPEVAEKFNVVGIPVLITVKDQKIVDTAVGGKTKDEVKALLGLTAKPAAPAAEPAAAAAEASEDKVCLPGFNECERPERKKPAVQSGVCLPGFNECERPERPKVEPHGH